MIIKGLGSLIGSMGLRILHMLLIIPSNAAVDALFSELQGSLQLDVIITCLMLMPFTFNF